MVLLNLNVAETEDKEAMNADVTSIPKSSKIAGYQRIVVCEVFVEEDDLKNAYSYLQITTPSVSLIWSLEEKGNLSSLDTRRVRVLQKTYSALLEYSFLCSTKPVNVLGKSRICSTTC